MNRYPVLGASTVARLLPVSRGVLAALAIMSAAGSTALAQPVLIVNGLSDDISADGTKSVGLLFDYSIPGYVPFVWQRGAGYTQIPGSDFGSDPVRASSDCTSLATGRLNAANWGDLNCFNGYCAFGDCVPGELLPPPAPCMIPSIAHSWSSATGWVNAGSVARELDPGTGRFFGGTRCDTTINSVGDFSGSGRYIVGGAWTSPLFSASGGPAYGMCGDLAAYRADTTTHTVTALPVQPGTTGSRADSVSNDGSVITGYDFGTIIDPEFGPYDGRRICVWTNGVQTLIDSLSGSYSTYVVNGPGTVIAGGPSPVYSLATFGVQATVLVKWSRQPDNSWAPQNLGGLPDFDNGFELTPASSIDPVAISDDGATIVGNVSYGSPFFGGVVRPFIWSASINGGAPIDLQAYLAQIAPGSPVVQPGFELTLAKGLSADGNGVLISVRDASNTCPPPNASLDTGNGGVLYLNGAGIACEQPRIAIQPRDYVSTQYTPFGVALNVFASGTWPMTYTWQREDTANPGQWTTLTEACAGFGYGAEWDYEGVHKNQLRVGQATCGNNRDGRYRVIVSNSCGTVTSEPAMVTFTQGTQVLQQPENAQGCPTGFASFQAIAVSNSADLAEQWEIADAQTPTNFSPLTDGVNTLSDGRTLDVFGAQGQFLGMTIGGGAGLSSYVVRCIFLSPCGDAMSSTATLDVGGPTCVIPCDSIDFNHDDIFPDTMDIGDFLTVFGGGACSNDPNCGDIDFNNDGLFPDTLDIDSLISVFSGGACV